MNALILYGGWEGHEPKPVSEIIESALKAKGVSVTRENSLDPLTDAARLAGTDVIIPIWTMGTMTNDQWKGMDQAVRSGVGFGGFHGGAGDAFRGNLGYQWMVGGQFVGHPTVGEYEVYVTDTTHPITTGLPTTFSYKSEQYYQIVDPGITVLAATPYNYDGHRVVMPCVWTKTWGKGRVFYSALGHVAKEFKDYPHVLDMTVRGILWAARKPA